MVQSIDRERMLTDLVRGLLPTPVWEELTPQGLLLKGGDPGLVAVRISRRGLSVLIYGVRWDGPCTPVADHRQLCHLPWKLLPADPGLLSTAVEGLIRTSTAIRQAQFIICKFCERQTPPEWACDNQICHSCAENYLGVKF
jgi:hypothetical protein